MVIIMFNISKNLIEKWHQILLEFTLCIQLTDPYECMK